MPLFNKEHRIIIVIPTFIEPNCYNFHYNRLIPTCMQLVAIRCKIKVLSEYLTRTFAEICNYLRKCAPFLPLFTRGIFFKLIR